MVGVAVILEESRGGLKDPLPRPSLRHDIGVKNALLIKGFPGCAIPGILGKVPKIYGLKVRCDDFMRGDDVIRGDDVRNEGAMRGCLGWRRGYMFCGAAFSGTRFCRSELFRFPSD